MIDLIVFSVGNNHYALNIENIQRIIQARELTAIPNANELIDGMMSHEGSVIKVLNFRKMIGLIPHDKELQKSFAQYKVTHQAWMDALKDALENGTAFTKTTNPHKGELGMWLNSFNSYDDGVSAVLKDLLINYKHVHTLAGDALEMYKTDQERAKQLFSSEITKVFNKSMHNLDTFIASIDKVSSSLQKLILYEKNNTTFAIKVDAIEDITHIEESMIMNSNDNDDTSKYLELSGILDIDGVLINVIKNIDIPK